MDQIKNNYKSDDSDYIDDCGRRWTKVSPAGQGSRTDLYSDEDQTFRRPGASRYYRRGRDHPRTVSTVRNRSLPAFHTQHHYSQDQSRTSSRARSASRAERRERSWERPSEREERRRSRSRSRTSPKQDSPKMTNEEKDAELINSLIEGVLWEPIRKEVVARLGKEISAEVLVFREELKGEMKKLKQWIGVVRYQHMLLCHGISREVLREIKPRLSKLRSKMDIMYKDVVEILERKKMGNVFYETGMNLEKDTAQMLLKGDVFKSFELMEKRHKILEELEELEKAEEELEKESEEFSEGYITPPPKQPHPLILTPDGCITPPLTQPSKVPEAPIGPILQPNGTFNFNQKAQEEEKEENPQ